MELILEEHEYRLGKLDVFTQFHVSRRLVPILIAFAKGGSEETLADILEPVVLEIAKLGDADANYILHACLNVVYRRDSGAWVKLKPSTDDILQFQDVTIATMLRLVVEVIKENLGSFFADVPTLMTGQTRASS